MSLKARYKTITILEEKEPYFGHPGGWSIKRTFKGLIQPSEGSKTFNNGKDTTNVNALLFCDINEKFEEKDVLEYKDARYKIGGAPVKPDGITGITPKRGQHAEYYLVYIQKGI